MLPAGTVLEQMRAFSLVDRNDLLGDAPVLVLAPHPDDESLGCGGLISACQRDGQAVHVIVLTDGTGSHPNSRAYPPQRLAALRMAEARAAVAELGLPGDRVEFLGLPDGHAPLRGEALRRVVAQVAARVRALQVGTICATWLHDPHPDHKAANLVARGAAQATGAKLLSYPVWGWMLPSHAWLPAASLRGMRLDISADLPAKRRAIACHRSQTTPLIDDDPTAFRLAADVLANFDRPFEVFVGS